MTVKYFLQFFWFVKIFLLCTFRGGYAPFVGGDAHIAPLRIENSAYRDDVNAISICGINVFRDDEVVVPYEFDSFSG